MNYRLPFERYEIYQMAVRLSLEIYSITKKWPNEERFGMISQIRRASMSVGANIAEGTARFSEKEKARFIEIAFGSLMEVAHFLYMAKELSLIDQNELNRKKETINKLANKLNAFSKILKTPSR